MDHSETSVLLGWIALGEAAPVAALAIVCLLSAAVVAGVLGGLSVVRAEVPVGEGVGPQIRAFIGLAGTALGVVALAFMLRTMRVDGAEWYTTVGLFTATMLSFIAAQFSLAPKAGAERPATANPQITVRPVSTTGASQAGAKKAA